MDLYKQFKISYTWLHACILQLDVNVFLGWKVVCFWKWCVMLVALSMFVCFGRTYWYQTFDGWKAALVNRHFIPLFTTSQMVQDLAINSQEAPLVIITHITFPNALVRDPHGLFTRHQKSMVNKNQNMQSLLGHLIRPSPPQKKPHCQPKMPRTHPAWEEEDDDCCTAVTSLGASFNP